MSGTLITKTTIESGDMYSFSLTLYSFCMKDVTTYKPLIVQFEDVV
jgi:hypothetical protein